MKKFTLILWIYLFVFPCISAQNYEPGYIINLSGDTITGFLQRNDTKNLYPVVKFKKEITGDSLNIFRPGQISSFTFMKENLSYYSVKYQLISNPEGTEHESFAELLLKGPVNIYKLAAGIFVPASNGMKSAKAYVIEKGDIGYTIAQHQNRISVYNYHLLDSLFADCAQLPSSRNIAFSDVAIVDLAARYNGCINNLKPESDHKLTTYFAMFVVIPTGILASRDPNGGWARTGLGLEGSGEYPLVADNLFFQYSLNYKKLSFSTHLTSGSFKGGYNILTGAVGLKAELKNRYLSPYIGGLWGPSYTWITGSDVVNILNESYALPYSLGIGVIILNKVDLGIRYISGKVHYVINGTNKLVNITMFRISAGYMLKY